MRKRRLSVFDENIVAEKANLVMRIANLKAKLWIFSNIASLRLESTKIFGEYAAPRISGGFSRAAFPRQRS